MTALKPKPARRRPRSIPPKAREKFLKALAAGWSVRHAARLTTHAFQRFYELRAVDEEFAAAWSDAVEQGTQRIEDEMLRRGVEGWDEPVYQKGELVGHVRKYSDPILALPHRIRRPDLYRETATPPVTIVLREYRLGETPEVEGGPAIIEGRAPELPPRELAP
jgi:hypothetical protein